MTEFIVRNREMDTASRNLSNLISDALAIEEQEAFEAGKVGFMARTAILRAQRLNG